MEKSEVLSFVKRMEATDHVIMFYSNPDDKRFALFAYLKAGLEEGEAAAYVAGEESVEEVKRAMREFGFDVDRLESLGALRVIDYKDWYIIGGNFDMAKTLGLWKKLYEEAVSKGFKGLRVTGEMACFFKHGMVDKLVEYEKVLHRRPELPMAAICAYNTDAMAKEGGGELYLNLIKAHSTVIFLGPRAGVVKSY